MSYDIYVKWSDAKAITSLLHANKQQQNRRKKLDSKHSRAPIEEGHSSR